MARREVEGWALDEGNRIAREMSLKEATYVTIAKGLQRERARAVRIVKGLRTRMYKSHCEESSQFCIGYQQAIDDLLAALTKGRA